MSVRFAEAAESAPMRVPWCRLGGGSRDMVGIFEVVFLMVCVLLGLRWFLRTNLYRAHRRSPRDPGQHGHGLEWGIQGHTTVDPPVRRPHQD